MKHLLYHLSTEVRKWPPKTGRRKSPISENWPSFGWLDGHLAKSLTRTNFHFPLSNFVYYFTLDNSNNVFQDVTSKKIDIGYSPARKSVLGKTVPEALDTQDTWVLKTEGIVSSIRIDIGW